MEAEFKAQGAVFKVEGWYMIVGFGCILVFALHGRASSLYRIREEIRRLYF
jgi:hypothetical protein